MITQDATGAHIAAPTLCSHSALTAANAKLIAAAPQVKEQRDELLEALKMLTALAQSWCDAVDNDSSWDGWDSDFKEMFKEMKWNTLPLIKATIAKVEGRAGA